MIDHLLGRPSLSWKRSQVFLVIFFWLWRIIRGKSGPPGILWLPKLNKALRRFSPWQVIVSTLTSVYAIRNFDQILGLSAPEPLANLYSRSYYRATWIATGFDAGFATAMSIRPKWCRDICSIIFSVYYIIYANAADEKVRRFRAVPTVEMLRATWEKTTNPYIRFITHFPRVSVRRKIHLPRPKGSRYDRPITAYLFFAPPENQLCKANDLILDVPGGGFVAMNPEHHEERLRHWAIASGRPVLSVDYGKAPEYPYPFASDEIFDLYTVLVESSSLIGISGNELNIILSGDSAGATIAVSLVLKILEHNQNILPQYGNIFPLPIALVLNYAALDFNFSSWMSQDHLRILRSEQSSGNIPGIKGLTAQKDHLQHISPLSMVKEKKHTAGRKRPKRQSSWKEAFRGFASNVERDNDAASSNKVSLQNFAIPSKVSRRHWSSSQSGGEDKGILADAESDDDDDYNDLKEEDRPLEARVRYAYHQSDQKPPAIYRSGSILERHQEELSVAIEEANSKALKARGKCKTAEPLGTRLTMTSRTGYFQDRIISPSMMRAMAILYIGPHRNPNFSIDYHISPILAPAHLLAQFPPLLMQCGEKDPFVDDTVIFAGRVREAKRARKTELDLLLSGKSARFGESLRMSTIDSSPDTKNHAALKAERDKLAAEEETDWVEMVLFSEWSHGYLQMTAIMPEARAVILEVAEWISDFFATYRNNFAKYPGKSCSSPPPARVSSPKKLCITDPSPLASETEADEVGITFSPKKGQDMSTKTFLDPTARAPPPIAINDTLLSKVDSSGSDATLLNDHSLFECFKLSDEDHNPSPSASHPPTPDCQKSSARRPNQTITEVELLRRRRLLDSHIFN